MSTKHKIVTWLLIVVLVLLFALAWIWSGDEAALPLADVTGSDPTLAEPDSQIVPTVGIAEPVGWQANEVPRAAEGLAVTRFAEGLDHPRVLYTLPNGDVLAALARAPKAEGDGGFTAWIADKLMTRAGSTGVSPDRIVLLRDSDKDGTADQRSVLVGGLSSPSGMAWGDGTLYVANHDALLALPYELGTSKITAEPRKLMDLPGGGQHWMRNIVLSPDGKNVYVAVGSSSNIADNGIEAEQGRASIWEYNLESGRARIFATGLRNPNGLAWNPWSDELWTTVNERDMLGSDLVPDYLTNVPIGAQYGWPWVYWKSNIDRRVEAPMPAYLIDYARRPEFALGPHVAALGLTFTEQGSRMGETFGQGAFIARHGSWNRHPASGYDVVYVAFDDLGNPQGKPVPVLSGFLTGEGTTRGRPTWVAWSGQGALLVSDDTAGIVWRVVAPGAAPHGEIVRKKGTSLPPQRELRGSPTATFSDDYARIEPAE